HAGAGPGAGPAPAGGAQRPAGDQAGAREIAAAAAAWSSWPGAGWAGGQEILVVPGNPRTVLERLDAHAPFGTPTRYGPALPTWSGILLPAPEPGIDAAQVSVGIAAYSGSATLVVAYAYATWRPARTAAEHLDPSGLRAVTVGEARL